MSRTAAADARAAPARRLAGVAALYAVYLAGEFVFGPAAFVLAGWNWAGSALIVPTLLLMLHAGRSSGTLPRGFAWAQVVGLVALAVSDASYGPPPRGLLEVAGATLPLSDVAYLAFLASWIAAWTTLLLALARRHRPSGRTIAVFALLMAGVAGLFAGFYTPLYRGQLGALPGRIGATMAALELAAIVATMAVILLGAGRALVLQGFGIALLAASDMLYAEAQVRQLGFAAADPVWTLGLALLLAGALLLPRGAPGPAGGVDDALAGGAHRSGLSTVLLALSLGAVLLSAAVSLALRRRGGVDAATAVGEPFFYVLFIVVLVIVMVALTERFDRAVQHAQRDAVRLLAHRLQAPDWRHAERPLVWILEATGLARLLDALHDAAGRLRGEVLFLGPERLNPPPQEPRAGAAPSCFIVMPFGQGEADAVHTVLRSACERAGLRPLRGDDLFTPTDILDDIWRGLTGAACVIADISGRNPNVMYELGIAHTLAKPVLILSRSAQDIPIDLATRRVIVYGTGEEGDWQARLAGRVETALRTLVVQYGISAGAPRTAAPPGASR